MSRAGRPVLLVLVLAVVTGVLGIAAVLAPVDVDDPVLTWPRAGEEPTSTVVPLVPYRPLELRAEVPCAALSAVDGAGPGGGEVLRTLPRSVDAAFGTGLVVAASGGGVTVESSGERLLEERLGGPACDYTVVADAGGTRVLRDGVVVVDRPGLLPPQVAQFETGVEGRPEAAGLAVELRTDARYQSTPTPLKTALLIAHGLALVALLAAAWRAWPGRGPGLVRPRSAPADAVVVAVSAAWTVLGPVNIDDSWYMLMARGAGASGYVGNYIYQFNVTENPFVLAQYLMQAWGGLVGWELPWLRMLPLVYGLLTYLMLRVLLATVLGRAERGATWALAVAHLLWFLPYGITLRPETVIVVLSAVVLLLVELARRRESIGMLALATAVAALAMTVSPTALVAVAPLVLALPWFVRWLRDAPVIQRVATGLLAAACATAIVPVGFADASLGDVREAVAVHRWYYRQFAWYAEFEHYATLLDGADTGAWGKRLPVLLTLAVLLGSLLSMGRSRGTGGPAGRLLATSALVSALGLASLALTPTKWVNHFGALAAPATLLIAVALLRSPLPRRAGAGVLAVGSAAMVAAAAVGFAGPNLWRPFSDWGQPFGNHADLSTAFRISETAPGIGPLELRNPLLWTGVAVLAMLAARRRPAPTPDRAVLGVAAGGGVVLMLLVFVAAPLFQAPGPSVAALNLRGGCGLAGSVTVLDGTAPGAGLGASTDSAVTGGEMTPGRPPDRGPVPAAPQTATWHTDVDGGDGTGEVRTPWYPVPAGDPTDAVVVSATGDLRDGQDIVLQFDTGEDTLFQGTDLEDGWVDRLVLLGDLAQRPTAVRVVATDSLVGDDTWLAVSAPRLAVARTVPELTAGAPVFADQVSAVLWPCVDRIEVRDGLAEAPEFRLRAGDGLEEAIEQNAFFPDNGGTLAGVDRTAEFVELPSTLDPPGGSVMQAWGHVERVEYDHPPGAYDVTVGETRRPGWTRLPTLVGPDYTGRIFIG